MYAFLILLEGGGTLTRPGIELHETTIGGFVETIKGQPASCISDCGGEVGLAAMAQDQSLKHICQFASQSVCLEKLPIVEGGAILKVEASHEIVAIEPDRPREWFQAVGADLVGAVAVHLATC